MIPSTLDDEARVEEAMYRSVRCPFSVLDHITPSKLTSSSIGLDRCILHHLSSPHPHPQSLFAIIQGGLSPDLRARCLSLMLHPARRKHLPGYAVGGLSGGEEKSSFWRIVRQCAEELPEDKPRYCMGIG